jgi:chromosome segregation ATPase
MSDTPRTDNIAIDCDRETVVEFCKLLEREHSGLISDSYDKGFQEGASKQAILELRGRDKFLVDLRSKDEVRQREHAALLADANAARVKAEQERDKCDDECVRLTIERDAARTRAGDLTTELAEARQEAEKANERAANLSVELAAMTLSRDQERQEADRLKRQVEVLCRKLASCALLPNDTSSGLSPVQAWREWAAQEAKEAK